MLIAKIGDWAKRYVETNFEHHLGRSYHVTRALKLAILRLFMLKWSTLELSWRDKICPDGAQNWFPLTFWPKLLCGVWQFRLQKFRLAYVGCHWNCLDMPVLIAAPKPLMTEVALITDRRIVTSLILYFCSCFWTSESSLLRRLFRPLHLCVPLLLLLNRKVFTSSFFWYVPSPWSWSWKREGHSKQ